MAVAKATRMIAISNPTNAAAGVSGGGLGSARPMNTHVKPPIAAACAIIHSVRESQRGIRR